MTLKIPYKDRIFIPIHGGPILDFCSKTGLLLAHGYNRIEIGDRGPYVEFEEEHIIMDNISVPPGQMYRLENKQVYYNEFRSKCDSNVKFYYQKRTVNYADYKVGKWYVSPFDLLVDDISVALTLDNL